MRTLIEMLDAHFDDIDRRQRLLLERTPDKDLFRTADRAADTMLLLSVGGLLLRSAAMVEQAFLGITRRLWDDPFEWTLPERLSTREAIVEYLDEVAATRKAGIGFLASDRDLTRQLPAPERLKPIGQVLLEAAARAENYMGRGEAVAKVLGAVNVS